MFPSIKGFEVDGLKPAVWVGGETEALARLEHHLERKAWVASFGRPKMTPQSLLPSQTGLSPYLRFGCLSTRLFYYQLTDLYKKVFHTSTFSVFFHFFLNLFKNLEDIYGCRSKRLSLHSHYMDSYFGVNFFIVLPHAILTLTKWKAIQSVCKFPGTAIQRPSLNGLV